MKQVAVLMKMGYEEGETLTIVDLLRRAGLQCDTFSFDDKYVEGMHHMFVKSDAFFSDKIKEYDMIILPGGNPGGENLLHDERVIELVQYFNDHHKLIGAICSGTQVLEKANVIRGKKVTGYQGYQDRPVSGKFVDEVVVYDQNIITSQGPATVYPFAFGIIEAFGIDTSILKQRLMYNFAGGK